MTARIDRGIVVNCAGLTDEQYGTIANILVDKADAYGGNDYSHPRRQFLLIDGEGDVNAVSARVLDLVSTEKFLGEFPKTCGFYGAAPYEVSPVFLLPEE